MPKQNIKQKIKYCQFCDKNVTTQNFSTHKKTKLHMRNKIKYKPVNLLDGIKKESYDIKYAVLQLEETIDNLQNVLNNIKSENK